MGVYHRLDPDPPGHLRTQHLMEKPLTNVYSLKPNNTDGNEVFIECSHIRRLTIPRISATTNIHHVLVIIVPNPLKDSIHQENRNSPRTLQVQQITAYTAQSYSTPRTSEERRSCFST
jgi:hypothetical protein